MDAESAIRAHKDWKDRLRMAMGTREVLKLDQIASDQCCNFGRWLHGEGRERFSASPSYETCVTLHANFHGEAAVVAQAINEGRLLEAEKMLAHGTPYAKASDELVKAVIVMFRIS